MTNEDTGSTPEQPDQDALIRELVKRLAEETIATERSMENEFPEHAKFGKFTAEAQLLHVFIEQFLPTRGIVLARYDETGNLVQYVEGPESPELLMPMFFGIDMKAYREEVPKVAARLHVIQSERELLHPDPELAEQMVEFEKMLAEVGEVEE